MLDKQTSTSLWDNFPAYASVTQDTPKGRLTRLIIDAAGRPRDSMKVSMSGGGLTIRGEGVSLPFLGTVTTNQIDLDPFSGTFYFAGTVPSVENVYLMSTGLLVVELFYKNESPITEYEIKSW